MIWSRRHHGVEYLYSLGPQAWAARCRCRQGWVARGPGARQRVLAEARAHAGTRAARTWPRRGVIDLTDALGGGELGPATAIRRQDPVPHRLVAAFTHLLSRH